MLVEKMKTSFFTQFVTAFLMLFAIVSCGNHVNNDYEEEVDECGYSNPIDSIVSQTTEDIRLDEVYKYLIAHRDYIDNSDSVGYSSSCGGYDNSLLWKDCGEIRVYSIPEISIHAILCSNFVQFKGKDGRIDTLFLEDNYGELEDICKIVSRNGKTYYFLKTKTLVCHQGAIKTECINAFSIENGRLVKEKLFHTKTKQYDAIEVECGGQRYLPIDYYHAVLICMDDFDGTYDNQPRVVIAEINENDWPTGYGLEYQWNGEWFDYVGRCNYDADGMVRGY